MHDETPLMSCGGRQDTLQAMRGAALLAHDLLVEGEEQPPEQLLSSAVLLHDYGLLVSRPWPWRRRG